MQDKQNFIRDVRKRIQDSHVNFLIGAGLSSPYLKALGNIEQELNDAISSDDENKIISVKKEYFNSVMKGNLKIINNISDIHKDEVLENYREFYKLWNNIILYRKSTIISKQINIFTTNIDVFSEKALEETKIEFNDGFYGRFDYLFDIGNFKKSFFKKSLHYENTFEIPVFNLLKIHGSLTWKLNSKQEVIFNKNLESITEVSDKITDDQKFEEAYDKLLIVNPASTKFENTLLNQYYYDLLRIYTNELEKENSILFVLGFSFADSHIKDLTLRVANSNPTLQIYIFTYSSNINDNISDLKEKAKNKNIEIISPIGDGEKYDLKTLNGEYFSKIIRVKGFDLIPNVGENLNETE